MKIAGFSIIDAYAIEKDGEFFDLHNDFEMVTFEVDLPRSAFLISWQRLDEPRVSKKLPNVVRLIVAEPDHVRFLPAADDSQSCGGRTLSFIGFLHVDQKEAMDGCVTYSEAGEHCDFIVGFEDLSAIKVFGRQAEIRVETV